MGFLMTSAARRLPALGAIAIVALLAAACSGNSNSSPAASSSTSTVTASSCISTPGTAPAPKSGSSVIGRSTTVVVFPSFATALKKGAVAVAPVSPASVTRGVFVFPISDGQIAVATFAGTFNHSGGLTFCRHGKRVELTDFVMNTHTKRLTATVDGKSLPIFDLNLASLKRASEPHRTIIATNIGLTVTPQAASALNSDLGTTTFKGGQAYGVATMVIRVK